MTSSRTPFIARPFANYAATAGIVAVGLMVFVDLAIFPRVHGYALAKRTIEIVVPIIGLALCIISLVAIGIRGQKGIVIKSVVGICVNALYLQLVILAAVISSLVARNVPHSARERYDRAIKKLSVATTEQKLFYALGDAAKSSFGVGAMQAARQYATKLLEYAPDYEGNWNYGNAIHDGNLVLGRIAVRDGNIETAKSYLIAAGKTPGSPTLDSFGPNMSLAKDLIEHGERQTVLQYFQLCSNFWQMDHGKLDEWSRAVKSGKTPNFGANLKY